MFSVKFSRSLTLTFYCTTSPIQNLYDMRNVKELLEAALLSGGAVGRAGAEGQSSNGIGEWSTPIVVAGEVSVDQLRIGIQQALALGAKTAQIRMLLGGAKTMLSLRQAQLDDDWGEVARLIETIDDADAAQSARAEGGEGDVSMPALCYDELNLARAECEHREATMSSALAEIAPFEVTTPTTSNVLLKQELSIEYRDRLLYLSPLVAKSGRRSVGGGSMPDDSASRHRATALSESVMQDLRRIEFDQIVSVERSSENPRRLVLQVRVYCK